MKVITLIKRLVRNLECIKTRLELSYKYLKTLDKQTNNAYLIASLRSVENILVELQDTIDRLQGLINLYTELSKKINEKDT